MIQNWYNVKAYVSSEATSESVEPQNLHIFLSIINLMRCRVSSSDQLAVRCRYGDNKTCWSTPSSRTWPTGPCSIHVSVYFQLILINGINFHKWKALPSCFHVLKPYMYIILLRRTAFTAPDRAPSFLIQNARHTHTGRRRLTREVHQHTTHKGGKGEE